MTTLPVVHTEIWDIQPARIRWPEQARYAGWEDRVVSLDDGAGELMEVTALPDSFNILVGNTDPDACDASLAKVYGVLLYPRDGEGNIASVAEVAMRVRRDLDDNLFSEVTFLRAGLKLSIMETRGCMRTGPWSPFAPATVHAAALLATGLFRGWSWTEFVHRYNRIAEEYPTVPMRLLTSLSSSATTWRIGDEEIAVDPEWDLETIMQVAMVNHHIWDLPRDIRAELGPGLLAPGETLTPAQLRRAQRRARVP